MNSSGTNSIALKTYAVTSSRPTVGDRESPHRFRDNDDSEDAEHGRTTPLLASSALLSARRNRAFKEWRPLMLASWVNTLLLLVEACIIAILIVVWVLSRSRNGAFEVSQVNKSFWIWDDVTKYYSLLWTSLPVFILSLYTFGWGAVVKANAELSPYIELNKGGHARTTVMLDYAALPLWKVWYVALRNHHYHIGVGFLLQNALTGFIVPISAHLLIQRPAFTSTTKQIDIVSAFSQDLSYINSTTNFQPLIDLASSIQVYNSAPPTWMTDFYAFEKTSFEAADGNLTAPVLAYFADLQCDTIGPGTYTVDQKSVQVLMNFPDRGCPVQQSFSISRNVSVHARAWQQSCSNDASSRIGMFVADQDASDTSKISNLRIVSCVPTYWQVNGTLNLTYDSDRNPSYSAFNPDAKTATLLSPSLRFALEQNIMFYSQQSLSNAIDSNAVGFTVYSVAQARNASASPAAEALLSSMQRFYSTIFAATMDDLVLTPSGTSRTVSAIFTTSSSKLFAVEWVIWTEVAVFVAIVACHIWLYIHSRTNHTMLVEEAYGLLGKAKLLRRSNLFDVVDVFEENHSKVGETQKYMKKHYQWGNDRCIWDEKTQRVIVEGFHE